MNKLNTTYSIYKITNILNKKYYIGAHKTKDINDNYMGSGVAIRRALDKYGIENFTKEILFELCSEEEMYLKEAEIITAEIVNDADSYNLTLGGVGGFSHIDSSGDNNPMRKYPDLAKVIGESVKQWIKDNPETHRKKCVLGGLWHKGRKDSTETKAKRAKSVSSYWRNRPKKFMLIHKDGNETLHATLSEICETYNLSRSVLIKWCNKGVMKQTPTATRISESAYNCYGCELILIKEMI